MIAQKKNNSKVTNIRNKPRVLLIDFSDEMKCKKEFTSYLNKLTDVNKDVIYSKISSFIQDITEIKIKNMLFDVLINFIKASSNNIYIDVLFLFDNDFIKDNINKYLEKFINNKEWNSEEIKIESKILYDNVNYDKYCIYVKIKKNTLSILKALLIILYRIKDKDMIKKLSNEIIIDLNEYLKKTDYKHIIELLLDELLILYDFHKDPDILNILKNIDLTIFEYSTKFKIIKIIERYELSS
jgi:hypothetical protein